MTEPTVLLINPPLWNPYAPHLAVPLLTGVLKQRGIAAKALDLSAETMRFVLSRNGIERLRASHGRYAEPARGTEGRHGELRFEAAIGAVDAARAYLRDPASIADFAGYRAARNVCQAVLGGLSTWFPGSNLAAGPLESGLPAGSQRGGGRRHPRSVAQPVSSSVPRSSGTGAGRSAGPAAGGDLGVGGHPTRRRDDRRGHGSAVLAGGPHHGRRELHHPDRRPAGRRSSVLRPGRLVRPV